jgi:hypothetical protein
MNIDFLKNRKLIALASILFLATTGFFVYQKTKVKDPEKFIDSKKIIFTAEEKQQIDKFLSVDDALNALEKGDPAAGWVIGQCLSSGQAGCFLDNDMAFDYFGNSAVLGFGPALYTLFEIYTFEENNPFLGMVYLNLTIASGHPELLHRYDDLFFKMKKDMGSYLTDELQKIVIHKRKLIEKKAESINEFNSFIEEDVLFDRNFWEKIYNKSLNTGNINNWLNNPDNVTKIFKQLLIKEEQCKNKGAAYE